MKTPIASAMLAMALFISTPMYSAAENPRINPFTNGLDCLRGCIINTKENTMYREACVADCYVNFLADLVKLFTR